jgi:hypothetical protein
MSMIGQIHGRPNLCACGHDYAVHTLSGSMPSPAAGTFALSTVASPGSAGGNRYVKVAYVNANGITTLGGENTIVVPANYALVVSLTGGLPLDGIGWIPYVSATTGTETNQIGTTTVPLPYTASWQEPVSGLVSGSAAPGSNTATFARGCSICPVAHDMAPDPGTPLAENANQRGG